MDLEKPKEFLNKLPLFKNTPFTIDSATATATLTGVVTVDQGKVAEIDTRSLGNVLVGGAEAFSRSIGAALSTTSLKKSFSTNAALLAFKVTLTVLDTPIEASVKIADLVLGTGATDASQIGSITPIEVSFKINWDLKTLLKLLPNEEVLSHFLNAKVEVGFKLTTTLGVDMTIKGVDKLDDLAKKALRAQENLVDDKYIDFLKKQDAFGELLDQQNYMRRLQEERKELSKRIAKEFDPKKKKQLLVQTGRRRLALAKEYKLLQERLQHQGVENLQELHQHLDQQGKQLEKGFQKVKGQYDEVLQKLTKSTQKVCFELLQKQGAKRLVSLIAKAVPGLNIISFAVDAVDVYFLVKDVYDSYSKTEADLAFQLEAEVEALINAPVDLTTLSPRVTDFYGYLGAGGKMAALTQPEADRLAVFFDHQFEDEAEFEGFMFAYGDYYSSNEIRGFSNEELIYSLEEYKLKFSEKLVLKEGIALDPKEKSFENGQVSNFFERAKYTIVEGDPEMVGAILKVDATCIDTKSGRKVQVNFPDDNLLTLQVVQNLGDGEYKLKPIEDYIITVEGFKTYRLRSTSIYIYNSEYDRIYRRPKK